MKISKTFPPNYSHICDFVTPTKDTIFTYGNTIYNPHDINILPDVVFHESIHKKQQGDNPETWWNLYLTDRDFRLSQEVEAYGEQYLFAKENVKQPRLVEWRLDNMAHALSGEVYGILLTYGEAKSKIRNYKRGR